MTIGFDDIDRKWSYQTVLYVCIACVCLFLSWAYLTEIDERVRGSGRIIPAGDTKVIQHLEGGILSEILAREGQTVEAGEVLFYIKNTRAESEKSELQVELNSLRIKKRRLEAELNSEEELMFPEEYQKEYAGIVDSEDDIFNSKRSELNQTIEVLKEQANQKVLELEEITSKISNIQKELSVAREQLKIKQRLRQRGVASRTQYLDTLSAVRNFETKLEESRKSNPIVRSELSEITQIIEETRKKYFTEASEEMNAVKVEIKKLQERLASFSDEVARTAIRSPVDGIVNEVYMNTEGGVVSPGGVIADLIPLNDRLIVEGRISTNDRGKIWLGLPVVAVITAYDFTLYGGLEGKLNYISANSFVDNQNQEYYQIRVFLDETDFGEKKPLFPGMTAELNVTVGKISVLHAILKPFWNIRNNAFREK